MGSVPGPILRFRVDASSITGGIAPAFKEVRAQAQTLSNGIAQDWQRMSTQLRASLVAGSVPQTEILAKQKEIVATLEKQIGAYTRLNELSTKDLSNLRAMTLELERQKNAMDRGVGVGITAGTGAFLGQLQQIGAQLSSRLVGSLGANIFGIAGGNLVGEAIGKGTPGIGAALGGVAAITAGATALTALAVQGGKFAVELDNTARKLGLTVDSTIRLRSAAEALDLDFDNLAPGFRKFSKEITFALTGDLPGASKEAQHASVLFKALGVDIKKAAEDPFYALQQLSQTLGKLPDGAIKTATAGELFGKSAQQLLPILDKMPGALDATAKSSSDLARAMGSDVVKSAEELKAKLVNFKNESLALQVALGDTVIPALVTFVSRINDVGEAMRMVFHKVDVAEDAARAQLRAQGKQLTPEGSKRLDFFLTAQNQNSGLAGGLDSYIADPQRAIDDFLKSKGGQGSGLLEAFSASGHIGGASKEASDKLDALAKIIGKTGESAKKTEGQVSESIKGIEKYYEHLHLVLAGTMPLPPGNVGPGSPLYGPNVPANPAAAALRQSLGGLTGGKYGPFNAPQELPPWVSAPFEGGSLNLGGAAGPAAGTLDILKQISDQHDELFTTQRQKDLEHYDAELKALDQYHHSALNNEAAYSAAFTQLTESRNKTLSDLNKKYEESAGKLFDDLVSGKGGKFGKGLQKEMENLVLAPFKTMFDQVLGGFFGSIAQMMGSIFHTGGSGSGSPTAGLGGWLGGLGGIFHGNAPGGTPGWWPGSTGLEGRAA